MCYDLIFMYVTHILCMTTSSKFKLAISGWCPYGKWKDARQAEGSRPALEARQGDQTRIGTAKYQMHVEQLSSPGLSEWVHSFPSWVGKSGKEEGSRK